MKFKSCDLLERAILFDIDNISVCCLSPHRGKLATRLLSNYHGEAVDWQKIFSKKEKIRSAQEKGKVFPVCEGCYMLEEKEWGGIGPIRDVHLSNWTHCNCDCFFCYFNFDPRTKNNYAPYPVLPILKDMKEKGILKGGGEIVFSGGEPTVLDEFDDLLNFFYAMETKVISVNSSVIKYNETLAEGLDSGRVELNMSLDSYDRESYKKIKRVDKFDDVTNNLRKYIEASKCKNQVRVKYIIIPSLNDSVEEVERWMHLCADLGVKTILIDFETKWFVENYKDVPKYLYDLVKYIQNRAKELDLNLNYYSHALQLLNDMS